MFNRIYLSNFEVIFERKNDDYDEDTITVAVSLYNYERFLAECLDSVSGQTYDNLDLIIVDDCSTKDDSLNCANDWLVANADRFRRSTLLKHKNNQGLAQARNTAFNYCRTNYVFVLDADNMIYPKAIESLARHTLKGDFEIAYSQIEMFGDVTGLGVADYWDRRFFERGNYVDAMALISKRVWFEVRGYTHLEGGWEDYDFWCKMIDLNFDAIFVPKILCRYRVHGSSMLRTETVDNNIDLRTEMTLRHPWLNLMK